MSHDNIFYNFIGNYKAGKKDGDKDIGITASIFKTYLQKYT